MNDSAKGAIDNLKKSVFYCFEMLLELFPMMN